MRAVAGPGPNEQGRATGVQDGADCALGGGGWSE
jgi:hypothetical protein